MLVDPYDLIILDLDGVVVLGDRPVPHAPEALQRLRASGRRVRFVTNNASRTAADVAALLETVGVQAEPREVYTSARAAAATLAERFPPHAPVLVVGAPALTEDVSEAGLRPVSNADDAPVAVVQGYGPDVGWAHL